MRTEASAVECSCQGPVVEYGRYSDLRPTGRLLGLSLDVKGLHLLLARILACILPFVEPSAVPVNIENGAKIMNEPDSRR